jgi:heat shock protein HspQ
VSDTTERKARFAIGDLVRHRLFDYRGVVYDVDPGFMLSDAWYEEVARSRPPRDAPWYRVLVHNAIHETYVAERNLEADPSGEPVLHPLVPAHFADFLDGRYVPGRRGN